MADATDVKTLKEGLTKFFGFKQFRNTKQEMATLKVLEGKRDVYLNMQPGDGKSLCFQLPTLLKSNAMTVVFVPSDVAAKSQVYFLRQNHIKAEYLSGQTRKNKLQAVKLELRSEKSSLRFLYIVADKHSVDLVKDCLIILTEENRLSYIVFDEAHCVSPLSDIYVPGYQEMAKLVRETCPDVCKIAVTSTAPSEVRRDLMEKLNMKNSLNFRSSRYYMVCHDVCFMDLLEKPLNHLASFIKRMLGEPEQIVQRHPTCGIVFCRKKRDLETVTEDLISRKFPAVAYHGDLPLAARNSIHERWINGEIRIIVATHKSGIGLHKPNVRFVVHWNLPKSLQQLYRECGNISHDGKIGHSRVYHSCAGEEDVLHDILSLPANPSESVDAVNRKLRLFEEVVNYCFQTTCRQVARGFLFEREILECNKYCDACADSKLGSRLLEIQKYRASMKKAIATSLSCEKVNFVQPLNHSRQFGRLCHELTENYKKTLQGREDNLTELEISRIACRLVNCLYSADRLREDFSYEVTRAALHVRKCTESGVACSYLKYAEVQRNPVFSPEAIEPLEADGDDNDNDVVPGTPEKNKTNDVVDDSDVVPGTPEKMKTNDVDDSIIVLPTPVKKVPELVDLESPSSPESETP